MAITIGKAFHDLVHLDKRQFGIVDHVMFNTQPFAQRRSTLDGRRAVAFNAFINGAGDDGYVSSLADQIDDSIEENGGVLAAGNGHEDGRVLSLDERELEAKFLADLLSHGLSEVFPAEDSPRIGLFDHGGFVAGIATWHRNNAPVDSPMCRPAGCEV